MKHCELSWGQCLCQINDLPWLCSFGCLLFFLIVYFLQFLPLYLKGLNDNSITSFTAVGGEWSCTDHRTWGRFLCRKLPFFLLFILYANIFTFISWWLFSLCIGIDEAKLNKCITALGGGWELFWTTESQTCKLWFSISANTVIQLNAWVSCQCQAAPVCRQTVERQGFDAEGPAEAHLWSRVCSHQV